MLRCRAVFDCFRPRRCVQQNIAGCVHVRPIGDDAVFVPTHGEYASVDVVLG